ncbi:hypothetical protein LPJ57_009226 [Coemansia sp. RSA 486]|nr:hypothetical protein LPJ57_009226 [Coemansia sp. RSA 486]
MDMRNPFAMFDSVSHNADRLARLDISANQLSSSREAGRNRLNDRSDTPRNRTQSQSQSQSQSQTVSHMGDIPFFASLLQQHSNRLSANGASRPATTGTGAVTRPSLSSSQSDLDSQRPTQMSAMSIVNPAYAGDGGNSTASQTLLDESRAKFRSELEQLEEMGFDNEDKNLQALIQTDGDLALALSIIADESDD